jgi:rhodanese-related sulfurtransferase
MKPDPMIEEIEPADLRRLQQGGELWQLLDVREAWELEIATLEGTINIPMAAVPERVGELDPGLPVAVLCHAGRRSLHVAGYLVGCGFDRVVNIQGGIDRWSQTVDSAVRRY